MSLEDILVSQTTTSAVAVTDHAISRVRRLQDMPLARYRAKQGGESSLLRDMQFMRLTTKRHGYQDRFLGSSWQA